MKIRKLQITLTLLGSLFFISSCAQDPKTYDSPQGYNFNDAEIIHLPDVLHEVSGIAFTKDTDNPLFAQEDESGIVYYFSPKDPYTLKGVKFAKNGDYEGIAVANDYIVVLKSDGTLYTFPLQDIKNKQSTNVKITKNIIPKGEYESLGFSHQNQLLYVVCKKCKEDKKSKSTSGYILSLSEKGEILFKDRFEIDEQQIENILSFKGKRFRPSAITYNMQSQQWFILDSINKRLVITDDNWQVAAVYALNPSLFNQPEAIAFDKNYNLYIGNEGGDITRKSTLLKFKFIK